MNLEIKAKLPTLLVCVALLATSSCSLKGLTEGKGLAEAAVTQFHSQFNAKQFHEIYVQTDEEFKKVSSEPDFTAMLDALHRKLGTVKDSKPTGWGVNATTIGTIVTVGYDVEFTEGNGTEKFVFR